MLILNIIVFICANIILHYSCKSFNESKTKVQRFANISWILLSALIIALTLEGIFANFGF